MAESKSFLKNSENCTASAEAAPSEQAKKRFERLAEGWKSVAETQAWLDGEEGKASSASETPKGA
jgi:hypothetical protein